jgi:hypothetical protein
MKVVHDPKAANGGYTEHVNTVPPKKHKPVPRGPSVVYKASGR